jgi:hypothetical protein
LLLVLSIEGVGFKQWSRQMDFGWELFKEGVDSVGSVLGIFKQVRDILPEGSKKKEIDEALQKAEEQWKLAKSKMAQGLGYPLCRMHFPPGIMLDADGRNWKCPECDKEKRPFPPIPGPSYQRRAIGEA